MDSDYLDIEKISLSVNNGPVVLQQFAHSKQLVQEKTSSCRG